MNERFEMRSVWSTKKIRYGMQAVTEFRNMDLLLILYVCYASPAFWGQTDRLFY